MKRLVIDIDDTICRTENGKYAESKVVEAVRLRLDEYRQAGFTIVLHTSRNMRTFDGNIGKINANTLPILVEWLSAHNIYYDEIYVGKPWCGHDGFYVDDKAIRPDEFANLSYSEICELLQGASERLHAVVVSKIK